MTLTVVPRTNLVLLVDEDLRTSRLLAEMLREDGLAVEVARDGAAAVARFTQSPLPDALVTELTTARVDAVSLSRFARAQRATLPVLVVTGYPNLFQPDDFGGVSPVLFTKPVDYSRLKESLFQALQEAAESAAKACSGASPEIESRLSDAPTYSGNALSGAEAIRALRRS